MKNYIYIFFIGFCACLPKIEENDKIVSNKLPYFNTIDFTPDWSKGEHKIPQFEFTNQNGDTISNDKFKGKIYIANFFFTICPSICPKLTTNMSLLQEKYLENDKVKLLSHTMMPRVDSVAVLKDYALKNKVINEKWDLVTGQKSELYKIARAGYFVDQENNLPNDSNDFIHTENFILVDEQGYIRGVYNGTLEVDVLRLIRHIDILLTNNESKR